MKNWKNCLFPILTCLTVAALALLPQRLSDLRDGGLMKTVHAEALSEDSNFPFKPPDLPGRVWLLVQWQEMPDHLTIMAQEPEGSDRDREIQRLQDALEDIANLLPPDMAELLLELDGDSWDWSRYYLRDQKDLSSASFSKTGTYDKRTGISFAATLDVESGQIIDLQIAGIQGVQFEKPPKSLGEALLDHLGLDYELANAQSAEGAYGWVTFRLPESKSWFMVNQFDFGLFFGFQLDWEAVDAETAESYGHPGTSVMDADSMQNR